MSKQYKNNSEMLEAVHETALGLRDAGVMDEATMKTFDEMCLTPKKGTRTGLSAYIDNLKQILKEGSKYRLWAMPAAVAMILAIVVYYPGDKDYEELKSMLAQSTDRQRELEMAQEFMLAPSTDRQRELEMAQESILAPWTERELVMAQSAHATDKIRLLVGTEERIKEDGLPETDYRWIFLAIGERLDLKGQELEVLIGLSGKLKKGSDYRVEKSQGTTFITFTNNILSGQSVLVVVEAEN